MTEFLKEIEQFHFLRPYWLLAIVPALILIVLMWKRKAAFGPWQSVISPHLLPHLLSGNVQQQSKFPLVLLLPVRKRMLTRFLPQLTRNFTKRKMPGAIA